MKRNNQKKPSKKADEKLYSQLSPCGHPAITDTPIIQTAAKPGKNKQVADV